jgi:hypothetical protein
MPQRKGGTETIALCPTHHRLLDNGRLSDSELKVIGEKCYSQLGMTYSQFIDWAYKRGYPYSLADMRSKAVRKAKKGRIIIYQIENDDLGS